MNRARPAPAWVELHRRWVHAPRVARLVKALAPWLDEGASLLDVGGGTGELADDLAHARALRDVTVVDVLVRPDAIRPVLAYDGEHLPFDDRAFDFVLLADVLHHAAEPAALLREALRVARSAVLVKDHLVLGPADVPLLAAMDHVGNHGAGVLVRGTYWDRNGWNSLVTEAGGRVQGVRWPVRIHDWPFRLLTRDELQLCLRIVRD